MRDSCSEEFESLANRVNELEKQTMHNGDCSCKHGSASPEVDLTTLTSGESFTTAAARAMPFVDRGRASVDATGNDNGFLNCVAGVWRNSSNMVVFRHSNTAAAFSNVRGGTEQFSIICGHGAPGIIVCGTGQVVDGTDKYMDAGNESVWRPLASQGVTGRQLTLFGCQVGAGSAGAAFLRAVSGALRKPVGAWTGDVWCGNGSVWGTGSFIVVQPGRSFDVVEAPDYVSDRRSSEVMKISSHNGFEDVPLKQVVWVNYTAIGSLPENQAVFTAQGKDAGHLLSLIDFERPFVTEDRPGAILSGLLTIAYVVNKKEKVRSFKVLGYSLIEDVAFPGTFYHASKELMKLLRGG